MPNRDGLSRFFTKGVTAAYIAESLVSFDGGTAAEEAGKVARERGFEQVGVREAGAVVGYVRAAALGKGTCGQHVEPFRDGQVVADTTPLATVIEGLSEHEALFVSVLGAVGGIITRSDLQKPPVRMWLFGLISMLEMGFTQLLKAQFPNDTWKEFISRGRLAKAEELQEERRRVKRDRTLVTCLQFADKADILLKQRDIREAMGIPSRAVARQRIKEFESLRNNLAHSQDIVAENWDVIARLGSSVENILARVDLLPATVPGQPAETS